MVADNRHGFILMLHAEEKKGLVQILRFKN
jgi:hypothetical protein